MGYFFSLLSLSKSATNNALNWSELTLLIFGIVLAAGLVGEYRTGDLHSRRMKLFEMLVIIGVLGELLGDGGVFVFSSQLQVISDNEIQEANRKALDAKTSAHSAADAASRAEFSAQHANDQAELAKRRTKEALKQTSRLNWYVYAVMKQVNPRYLTFNTKRFVDSLKGKPKGTAEIWYVPEDLEAAIFASEIENALGPDGAGWDVAKPKALPLLRNSDLKIGTETTLLGELRLMASEGLSVAGHGIEPSSRDSAARLFIDALSAGMHASFVIQEAEEPRLPRSYVIVVVGHHNVRAPLFNFGQPKE